MLNIIKNDAIKLHAGNVAHQRAHIIANIQYLIDELSKLAEKSDYTKKKIEYINGNCIVRNFPNNQPTLEWAGAVIDLLEELKLIH